MPTPPRISLPARSWGVPLAGAAAAFAITAAIVAAVAGGMAAPSEQAIARFAAPERIASGSGAAPIEVTIHPSSIHVVGIVVERNAENLRDRARG